MKTVFGLATVVAMGLSAPAFGFGMTASQGAHHEKITRDAMVSIMQASTLESFAGKTGTVGAIGAPDVNSALSSATHCDNGDFFSVAGYPQTVGVANQALLACRTLIFDQIEQAVRDVDRLVGTNNRVVSSQFPSYISCKYVPAVSGRAKCNALQSLGNAFHASQDSYSHSNWVDQAASGASTVDNPPGLGQSGVSSFLESPTAAFPPNLISGCFETTSIGFGESNGCNYSGTTRVKHLRLNKDQPDTLRGNINDNFTRARTAAVAETRRKWTYFEARVNAVYGAQRGGVMICAMKTDNADTCSL